jgi:hypothetical protein
MTKELNYLSEKIERIEQRVDEIEAHLKKANGCGGRIGEGYRHEVVELKKEKEVLNNILSALTHNELVMFSEPKPYDPNDTSGIRDVPF